jgi:hypothetical protein
VTVRGWWAYRSLEVAWIDAKSGKIDIGATSHVVESFRAIYS